MSIFTYQIEGTVNDIELRVLEKRYIELDRTKIEFDYINSKQDLYDKDNGTFYCSDCDYEIKGEGPPVIIDFNSIIGKKRHDNNPSIFYILLINF